MRGYMGDAFGRVMLGDDDAPGDAGAVGTQSQYTEVTGQSVGTDTSTDTGSGINWTNVITAGETGLSQVIGTGISTLTGSSGSKTGSGGGGGGGGGGSSGSGGGSGVSTPVMVGVGLGLLYLFMK